MTIPLLSVPEHHLVESTVVLLALIALWLLLDWRGAAHAAGPRPGPAQLVRQVRDGCAAGALAAGAIVTIAGLSLEAPPMVAVFARYGEAMETVQFLFSGAMAGLVLAVLAALPASVLAALLAWAAPPLSRTPAGVGTGILVGVTVMAQVTRRMFWCGNTTGEEIAFLTATLFTAGVLAAVVAGAFAIAPIRPMR